MEEKVEEKGEVICKRGCWMGGWMNQRECQESMDGQLW